MRCVRAAGRISDVIGNDGQFARFCDVIGTDWARDPKFTTARVTNRVELIAMISEATRVRATDDWITLLEGRAIPCGPINDIGRAFADAQVKHRGLCIEQSRYASEAAHPEDRVCTVFDAASPLRLSDTPAPLR